MVRDTANVGGWAIYSFLFSPASLFGKALLAGERTFSHTFLSVAAWPVYGPLWRWWPASKCHKQSPMPRGPEVRCPRRRSDSLSKTSELSYFSSEFVVFRRPRLLLSQLRGRERPPARVVAYSW